MKKNKKGFTIVELVIVIAVIGILAAVLIPTFSTVVTNANKSAALSNCRNALTEVIAMDEYGEVEDGTIFVSGDYSTTYTNGAINAEMAEAPTVTEEGTDTNTYKINGNSYTLLTLKDNSSVKVYVPVTVTP